ncbi:hypothetical protein GLOTRDRAFT_130023 [Gloeophyllum trabeum ATCC 11539]|uniref:BTB domain-containing protein n=1 Tax=Gloeophyllum trabeum (strain ATCC 11539 / FP-39264 / Madison 617) TaxID=670483 RepID=S7Q592_GLOTA|nr:uncharacterized protein GLOTRDRAFT_130023 [Gloeophyllum trabeum ATCC 11539]EPQ54673.1 hypothetical protein GLOTRDRAFT_130023 [Gloeophyllum trabeum ATCC 11539]
MSDSGVLDTEIDGWETLEPARKRQRTSELEDRKEPVIASTEELVRDEKYYRTDGDCVIRVENTLFKATRDSSAFQHMFTFPAGDKQLAEGSNDDYPVRLVGDTVDQFRALLSIMYALPPELQSYNSPTADIDNLITVAEITNKYHFASVETWAVDALHDVLSGTYGLPQTDLAICDSALMARLLETAILCNHTRLRSLIVSKWTNRILLRDLSPTLAIVLADRHMLRSLQGIAYYVQLMEMGSDLSKLKADKALSRDQRARLLSGHWSLVKLWDRLRVTAPAFERSDGCTFHNHGCLKVWEDQWLEAGKNEKTLSYGSADVLGRLRCIKEHLMMNGEIVLRLTPQCRKAAVESLWRTIKEVEDGLADHFNDLTQCSE